MHEAVRADSSKIQAAQVSPGAGHKCRWHNHLPAWIESDPAWEKLGHAARAVLRATADACDPPDHGAEGHLIGAFGGAPLWKAAGVARSTYWESVKKLEQSGFLVLIARGGMVRVRSRTGIVYAANVWGIPAGRGRLDARRVDRECVRIRKDEDGLLVREVILPGEQAALWAKRRTTLVRGSDYPSPGIGLPPSGNRALPSPIPSPVPSPLQKNHDHGVAARTNKWDGTLGRGSEAARQRGSEAKLNLHVRLEDLTDIRRLVELHCQFCAADLIGHSEDDLLWFVGAAEHALRLGERNACGLFVATVRNKAQRVLWVTQADEESARRRLSRWRAER